MTERDSRSATDASAEDPADMTHPGADAASAGSGVPQAVAENHAVEGSKAAADESAAEHAAEAEAKRDQARRRRRIDQIFGDVLPDTTSDEREPGHHGGFSLEHYRASKPPHWGEKL